MIGLSGKFEAFMNNRWFVFVAAMWIQSSAGIGYLFGSISPVIKTSLGYNQRQIAALGVAKDLGDNVGILAGSLCEVLPSWGTLLVGVLQNFVGYGWVWLIVTHRVPSLPFWMMWILIFVGTNGETYFNTVALVSCLKNFPKSRGPIVGILNGFVGLSGAILTQIYAMINAPDQAALIFMIAVGPSMVVIALIFIVRPVGDQGQVRPSDSSSFTFIYSVCLTLAAYLMGVMLVEDLINLDHSVTILFTIILFFILLLPVVIPILLSFSSEPSSQVDENLLAQTQKQEAEKSDQDAVLSELEEEKPQEVDLLPAFEWQKQMAPLQAKLLQAAAEGAVTINGRKGPRIGEDFTLIQALKNADFWLIFSCFLLGAGSGLTVIDNLGQMSQSLGYQNPHIFVSMISIWNFLGRISGGYLSEIVVRDHAYPRPVAMAVAQVIMAVGHTFFAMAWPGEMYIGTLLVGLGYGAHWAIVPATTSELLGVKNFGALYNFLTVSIPIGSLVFSGLIAGTIYDREAEKQARRHHRPQKNSRPMFNGILEGTLGAEKSLKCKGTTCFFLTSLIMAVVCIVAVVLSMILVQRTKTLYAKLYGKRRS